MCRYVINVKEQCLVDTKTGDIIRPSCWSDLAGLYSYLVGSGRQAQADEMIKEVFKGEKVITKMIESYQTRVFGNTGKFKAIDSPKGTKDKK